MTAPPPPEPSAQILSLPGNAAVRRARTARTLRRPALALGLLAAATAVAAILGFRAGRVGYALAHDGLFGVAAPGLGLLAAGLAAAALALGLSARPQGGAPLALAALVIGAGTAAATLAAAAAERGQAARSPPVHEVSTDWRDPPTPTPRLLAARGPDADPIEAVPVVPEGPTGVGFLGRTVAEVNARTCPAAAPAVLLMAPPAAYTRLKAAARAQRMAPVTDDPAGLRLEATGRRGIWGVAEDLMARVRPEGAGARVDLRVAARQGLNDGGAACRRISRLRAALGR